MKGLLVVTSRLMSCVWSQADVLLHVFDTARVVVNLLLHLAFVFLQVGQSLLQMQVLLLLLSDGLVVRVADELETWHDVRHVVLVH